jgi:hypothetical protein
MSVDAGEQANAPLLSAMTSLKGSRRISSSGVTEGGIMRFAKFVTRGGVAALTGGLMSATVFLGPTPASAEGVTKQPILPTNKSCGGPTSNQAIGIAAFHRVGGTVDLGVHLDGAIPDTSYAVFLLAPLINCGVGLGRHDLVTNDKGVADGNFKFAVARGFAQATVFIADIRNLGIGTINETLRVTLLP